MDDTQLVERARAGDRDAFAALVERYNDLLVSLAAWYVGGQDAGDAAQEIWLAVQAKLWQLEDGSRFVPWLRKVAYYRCVNYRKARSRRRSAEVYLDSDDWLALSDFVATDSLSLHALLERKELRRLVGAHLDGLPADYGLVLRLRYGRGLTYHEIAKLANLPLSTVKWRLHEAKRLLKARLAHSTKQTKGALYYER